MNPRVPVEVQPTSDWDPSLYMKFADERMLAARDLLARVPLTSARLVYDLGCASSFLNGTTMPGGRARVLIRRRPVPVNT
jgi:trans-aconitate 2-methyltransferase